MKTEDYLRRINIQLWKDFEDHPGQVEAVRSWGLPKWRNCREWVKACYRFRMAQEIIAKMERPDLIPEKDLEAICKILNIGSNAS